MKEKKIGVVKKIVFFVAPISLFPFLFTPYYLVNMQFIVDWLGCGCPKEDEFGNVIHSYFSANDFTAVFWIFISVCATAISVFLSKKIFEKMWLRILYIVGVLAVSLLISHQFCQMMMWK